MAQNKTHGMLDATMTFQDGAYLKPTHYLLPRFLPLETCTGRPRTDRIPNYSIRTRLLRQRIKVAQLLSHLRGVREGAVSVVGIKSYTMWMMKLLLTTQEAKSKLSNLE